MKQYLLIMLFASLVMFLINMCSVNSSPASPPKDTSSKNPPSVATPRYGFRVENTFEHDPGAFTQGLVIENGILYEGTGERGTSSLRKVDLQTGNVLKIHELASNFFGEGITILGENIIQLTWEAGIGFIYDKQQFTPLDQFFYSGEGWGITYDGERLIVSNGSEKLLFLDPISYQVIGSISVQDNGKMVRKLNELEYIEGEIWANIWEREEIIKINSETGKVTGWIDLTGLHPNFQIRLRKGEVLNGIAYDKQSKRLFVTGKNWPKLYEIRIIAK